MVGVGVRMGWDIQEVPCWASSYVVACEFGSGFIVQVILTSKIVTKEELLAISKRLIQVIIKIFLNYFWEIFSTYGLIHT